jgi:hypothetical protein
VWFNRYRGLLLITVVTGVIVALLVQFFGSDGSSITAAANDNSPGLKAVAHFYLPALALDEFLILIAALAGFVAVFSRGLRSQFTTALLLWTLTSLVFGAFSLPLHVTYLPIVLLPMALLGALGIEWLHHLHIWWIAQMVLGVLALLTLEVQIVSTFVFYAPDASEPAWNRHASLYWAPLSTTIQTSIYCRRAMAGIMPKDATVYFRGDQPAIRWYLRDLRPVDDPSIASLTVAPRDARSQANQTAGTRRYEFDHAMTWPFLSKNLTFGAAVLYILASEAWASPIPAPVTITARPSSPTDLGPDDLGE